MCHGCLQGKNVTCPICQNSYTEHRLKCHIKTTHPGEQHKIHPHICCHYLYFSCYVIPSSLLSHNFFSSMCLWTDALPIQAKGVMVKRAEKCPYCDSYFLKNSSDYQRHIWAHQGVIFLHIYFRQTHMWLNQSRCRTFQVLMHLLSGPPSVLSPGCPPAGQTGL